MNKYTDCLSLCSYCQMINFDGLIRRKDPAKSGAPRISREWGIARELLERAGRCHLCRIFGLCLLEAWTGATPLSAEQITIIPTLGLEAVAHFPSGGNKKFVHLLNLSADEGPIPWSRDEPHWAVSFLFQAVTQSRLVELSDLKPAPLRPRPPKCDFSLLRTWLRGCETAHGSLCAPSKGTISPDFRLVDASNRCIVKASILPGTERYLALSYVWGASAQGWRLTMNRLDAAGKKGFLDTVSLPATISDAMELTYRLRERFLWVDSLCILQDSEEDKLQQISRMRIIYEQALITIVAASATNANGGLPGVRPGTRKSVPHVLRTEEMTLVSCLDTDPRDPWAWPIDERKWTFQEDVFSRRCLFFFEEQIYWRCRRTKWSEETLLQPTEQSSFDEWSDYFLEARSFYIDETTALHRKGFENLYYRIVSTYSARSTTYPVDALHAFEGVMSAISRRTDITFILAIPVPRFDFFLLWNLKCGPPNWYMNSETTSPLNDQFPSWSWLAWDRGVDPPIAPIINAELECYILDYDGVCLDLRSTPLLKIDRDEKGIRTGSRATAGSSVHPKLGWKHENQTVTTRDILALQVMASLVGRFHLFFWTSFANLCVCRDPEDDETAIHLPRRKGALSNSEDMFLETIGTGDIKCLELGRQVASWPTNLGPIAEARPSREFFIVVGSFDTEESRELSIMMIRWKDGIARRQCMTLINERDWMEADRDWRLIVLG